MMRRAVLVLLTGLAVLIPVSSASALSFGIADQKPAMFTDPLFHSLDIEKARLVVPWDVLSQQWQRDELDAWMTAAHTAKVRPLVSFGHSRREGHQRQLPSAERFRHEFGRLRHRYPWVTEWATWNEANHCSQPTCKRPKMVANYYDALVSACPKCTIVAAEVLDQPNMVEWINAFEAKAKHPAKVWGLHNYLDANRLRTQGTRALLAHTKGKVWFTETGGIVHRRKKRKIGGFTESPTHAAVATRWVFDELVPLSKRISRVYLYHWNPGGKNENWDSALLTPHGKPRPAFAVLKEQIKLEFKARQKRAKSRR